MNDRPANPLGPLPPGKPRWSPVKLLALGCGGLLVAAVLFVLVLAVVLVGSIRRSGAYQMAMTEVRESPAVREALGAPIAEGWWVMGSVNVSGPSGSANLSFPVSGPRGQARVFVEAGKRAGEWNLRLLEVQPEGRSERLDLLDESGQSFRVISAFLDAAASGDYASAHGLFAAALKDAQPFERFAAEAASHQALFRARELRLVKSRGEAGPRYQGSLLLEDGREVAATFELVREDGGWRFVSYRVG